MADKKPRFSRSDRSQSRRAGGNSVRRPGGGSGGESGGRPGVEPGLKPDDIVIYGTHAVDAALQNPDRRITRILATRNAADRLSNSGKARGLEVEIVAPEMISALAGADAVHQGMALIARPLETLDLHDIEDARFLVVLDQVTDPHNVGAIIRSAVALGVDALVTTHRNAARETGLLAKTASGGLDFIRLVHVPNLAQALVKLRDFGFVSIGLDSAAAEDLVNTLHGDKIALVLGAEGQGLRRLTRERCDALARLDMPGPIKSLNVSNAAALSLYLTARHLGI